MLAREIIYTNQKRKTSLWVFSGFQIFLLIAYVVSQIFLNFHVLFSLFDSDYMDENVGPGFVDGRRENFVHGSPLSSDSHAALSSGSSGKKPAMAYMAQI